MMELTFYKLDGAGNDFVGLDWRKKTPLTPCDLKPLVRDLCDRYHGIGADGVLLVQDPPEKSAADFSMRYVNSDGSIGEMCGNGARCIAVFAHFLGAAPEKMTFQTDAGSYRAHLVGGGSCVSFPPVLGKPELTVMENEESPVRQIHFSTVGVPHAVLFVEDLEHIEVTKLGRQIRYDPAFPHGTNVNFAQWKEGKLFVRTYERGVEEETLACGTGSVASVCSYLHENQIVEGQEIEVVPTGKQSLRVFARPTAEGFGDITLEGPARLVFSGRVKWCEEHGLSMK